MPAPVLTGLPLSRLALPRTFGMTISQDTLADHHTEAIARYHAGLVTTSRVWGTLQPTQGNFSFTTWDAHVAWMIAEGKRGLWHTGVWHVFNPSWLDDALDAISPADAGATQALITAHFEGIEAYTGANIWPLQYFTVVNEIANSTGFRETKWLAAYGSELYVDWAFIEARRLWPRLRLIFNDSDEHYGGAISAGRRATILGYLTDALGRGVPIDVVGIEGHLRWGRTDLGAHSVLDTLALASFCQSVAALGLDVMVTELDCSPANDPGIDAATAETVSARLAQEYIRVVADNCNLIGAVLWTWTDRYQLENPGAEWFRPGMWDADLRLKRDRYDALVAGLRA